MNFSQTEALEHEVYNIGRLNQPRENHGSFDQLKCVVFVRPTEENVRLLCRELREPTFLEYHIFFSNIVQPDQERKRWLEDLAAADTKSLVRSLQEHFCDFYAVQDELFSLNVRHASSLLHRMDEPLAERAVAGLCSVLLAFKRHPTIRHCAKSKGCRRLAQGVVERMERERELFSFRQKTAAPPLLLILDRREDPVTPLLKQWTYQAMAHELIGIDNNRLLMKNLPGYVADDDEVVLSASQDPFFAANMYSNFGELGENVKAIVDELQGVQGSARAAESIEDLQNVVQNMPEIRKRSGMVSKHVSLVYEFKRQCESRLLLETSQTEQDLACNQDHTSAREAVINMLHNPRISKGDLLRVMLLYHLRYEKAASNSSSEFIDLYLERGGTAEEIQLLDKILRYGGADRRSFDLFENENTMARMRSFIKQPLKDVKNVYTQHTPLLKKVLELALSGRLDPEMFPSINSRLTTEAPTEVIVFMVGGATYEEAMCVSMINKELNGRARVILGGTHVHNSTSFLGEIMRDE
eukprot:TRINITY_DN12171_c0_g1_i2.p1 TRINITY_DN12171_c0_g1~~TRINITY_DN12171_c0_g1_i2.p1  ORF type:complete len:526 (-),score=138.87 TRINITY_DN12171_c0_g1_i2:205-1782(-)